MSPELTLYNTGSATFGSIAGCPRP